MAQYWVQREGETTGPFSGQQLQQMAAAGMIMMSDMISADKINWQVAEQVRGLFQANQHVKGGEAETTGPSVFVGDDWTDRISSQNVRPRGNPGMQPNPELTSGSPTSVVVPDSDAVTGVKVGQPAKRPARVVIWAILSLILGFPWAILMLFSILLVEAGRADAYWPWLLEGLVILSLVVSGIHCLKSNPDSRWLGYFTGIAYAILSIVCFLVQVVILISAWPFLNELQGPAINMVVLAAFLYLPYPIITIVLLNTRPARRYLRETTVPREQTVSASASPPILVFLLIAPLAAYFTYVSYDWIVHGKTTLATITEVRRTPEDNSVPASSRRVHRRSTSGMDLSVSLSYECTVNLDGHTAILDQSYEADARFWGNTPAFGSSDDDLIGGPRIVFSEPQDRPVVGGELMVAYLSHSPDGVKKCSKAYATLWRFLLAVVFDVVFVMLLYQLGRRIKQNS